MIPMMPALLPVAAVRGRLQHIVGTVIAENNMLVRPTDFNGLNIRAPNGHTEAWTRSNCSVTTPGGNRPDGSATQKLVEDGTNAIHSLVPFHLGGLSLEFQPTHVAWRYAFLVKPAGRTRCVAFLSFTQGNWPDDPSISIGFDLAGVQVFDTVQQHTTSNDTASNPNHWQFTGASITPAVGGYLLCTIDGIFSGTEGAFGFTHYNPWIALDAGSGTAARNITYTGDGTSGILVWWQSLMPRGAWSLNRVNFYDDFNSSSTIDINDTRAPGFNWYTHNLFPNTNFVTYGFVSAPPSFPTPAANISVANSKVTLTGTVADSQPGWMSQLWTVAYTGDLGGGPQGYTGFTYELPAFVEGNYGYDAQTHRINILSMSGTVAFWGFCLESMIGTGPVSIEVDIAEAANFGGLITDNSFAAGLHSSNAPAGTDDNRLPVGTVNRFNDLINPTISEAQLSNMHRYGLLLLDGASNDGTFGLAMLFFDGNFFGGASVWSPTFVNPPLPVGAFKELNDYHMPIFMNTGATIVGHVPFAAVPMTVDWVKVFTAPA